MNLKDKNSSINNKKKDKNVKFNQIRYIDRKTGEILIDKVLGENFLKFLYYNPFGKLALNALIKRKFLTAYYGKKMDKEKSTKKIEKFISDLDIDINEAEKDIKEFTSFNDFFYRKLKPNARLFNEKKEVFTSPADGKILAFSNINEKDSFFAKGEEFTLEKFFKDLNLSKKYSAGSMIIVRLAPQDYHRFHFPVDGYASEAKLIEGFYYSVSTHAIKTDFSIFCNNKRAYTILKTDDFGNVAICEIGATMVGGITQTYKENSFVKKGDEKGFFSFGGSTIILFFERDKIVIDKDIIVNTNNFLETKIYVGEKIGISKKL